MGRCAQEKKSAGGQGNRDLGGMRGTRPPVQTVYSCVKLAGLWAMYTVQAGIFQKRIYKF